MSLIRNDTASAFGLKEKDTSVTTTKVEGEEEILQNMVYCVPVASLDDGRRYSIKAFGIPSISEEVSAVQLSQITAILGLENDRFR